MPATAAYAAGLEANNAQISYAPEATWGQAPATTFQAIRFTGETLTGTKTRTRPQEINGTREAAAAVTTQESAGGQINFALSYGTYDDLLASALGADWQAFQVIAGVAADVAFTGPSKILISTTAGKYANINVGQFVRQLGFTNPANNGIFKVIQKVSPQQIQLSSAANCVTETPTGTLAQLRASAITNGILFKSLYLQERFASAVWLAYPGAYVTAFTLTGGIGQYLSGSFTVAAKSQSKAVADASTGGILAAPSGRVHDPVGNFVGTWWNGVPIAAVVESFTVTGTNDGAAADYGLGSPLAAGMRGGTMLVSGKLKLYFKDFVYYDLFKAETAGALDIITSDAAGNTYVIGITNANLMNPLIQAGGVNQPVMAEFDIEGNPATGGGTIRIDRLAPT